MKTRNIPRRKDKVKDDDDKKEYFRCSKHFPSNDNISLINELGFLFFSFDIFIIIFIFGINAT